MIHSNAGRNNQPRCPILFSTNSAHVSVLQPLVHLSVWGYKGSRRMGVDVQRGRRAEGGAVGCMSLEGLRGSLHRVESCLCGGTRTIIKDSTAASTWFACLIICHMLNITAISHIRALPLQQASLRLHESVGRSRPHAASFDADLPFEIILQLQAYVTYSNVCTEITDIRIRIFFVLVLCQNKTQFFLHKWKLNKIQSGNIFLKFIQCFWVNSTFVCGYLSKIKIHLCNFTVTFVNRFRAAIICWITD